MFCVFWYFFVSKRRWICVVSNCQLKLRDFVLCFLIFFRFQASLDLCCFQCSLDLHRMYLSKLCLNKLIFHVMEDLPKVLYVYIYHIFFTILYIFYNIIIYYNIFWMFIKTCFPNFASPTWYLLCTGFIFEITKENVI